MNSNNYQNLNEISKITISLLIVGIIIGVISRWIFPEADPPLYWQTGAAWWDEAWFHEARNGALFGTWKMDDFRTGVISPIYTQIHEVSFRIFGLNYFGLRLPTMAFGTSLLIMAYYQSRLIGLTRINSLIPVFVISCSFAMLGFSKTAILEPTLLFFISLSFTLLLRRSNRERTFILEHVLAGIFAGIALTTKISAVLFIIPVLSFYFLTYIRDRENRRVHAISLTSFSISALSVTLIIGYIYIYPELDVFVDVVFGFFLKTRQKDIFGTLKNMAFFINTPFFLTNPLYPALVFANMPAILRKYFSFRLDKVRSSLPIFIFLFGILIILPFDIATRRLLFLFIPMAIICGIILAPLHLPKISSPKPSHLDFFRLVLPFRLPHMGNKIDLLKIIFYFIASTIILFSIGGKEGSILSFINPEAERFVRYRILFLLSGIITLVALPYSLKNLRKNLNYILIFSLLIFTIQTSLWIIRLDYSVRDASRELSKLIPEKGTVVVGNASAHLSIETEIHPIFFYPGIRYANSDEEKIKKLMPRYMMISEEEHLKRMLSGKKKYSEWVGSYLPHEYHRFRLSNVQQRSQKIKGDYILYRLPDSVYNNLK